ncbi:MAG: undecaprenyldiphospho-muramoylpentapeptide beta-N-acetylglucosaminyltransferase [Candidatus Moranbacteria bacterium]|nr:undecaprenyldiphospho-muramoylpentapeptide beta-N-acetylglucosaminyltransferase [Candidatus Moranbacteria bacterium]
MRIVLTGGGTGGHIFPILVVARELKKQLGEKEDADLLFLGPDGELEKELMNKELIPVKNIICGKFRRYFSFRNLLDIFRFPVGFVQSLWHLLVFMPDAVFAKGGYASVPVVFAAWLYQIPIVIHESDVMPGLANQIMSKLARRVAVSFPDSEKFLPEKKVFLSGNPIRNEILTGNRENALKIFSLSPDKKTILVIGGSLGARVINTAILSILVPALKHWQIIHLTGKKEYETVVREAARLGVKAGHDGYYPYPFLLEKLPDAFSCADLVISRAGANVITEIAANAKPAILVPIEGSANKHQEQNALAFSRVGAAILLEQGNLGENILLEKIKQIIDDKELNFELSERIKKFYNPRAAETIAEEIIKLEKA